ncbi:unnamed protein product [Somion occarium]
MPSPQFFDPPQKSPMDPVQNLADNGTMDKVNGGPKSSKTENLLNKIDDAVASAQDPKGVVSTVVQPVKMLLESSGAMKAIEAGLNSFMEDIPWLMKGLDEVARIHPVVTVAVLAFKAVYNMELTRRENDKRIRALYIEMKDMMAVLIQLRDVKDTNDVGPDGKTIEARLQALIKQTAEDIKDCANACDTYAKKRLLVKVLKGYSWEAKLVAFVGTFTKRRTDFEQALAIHTARAVEAIHGDVHIIQASVDAVNAKLELFTRLFETFVPKELTTMKEKVKEKGDITIVLSSEAALRELNDFENSLDIQHKNDRSKKRSDFTMKDLREELRYDFETSVRKNLETFAGKFELYQRQLKDELTKTINDANNRILTAVKEGPHDKIRNSELKLIWKEMNWRRNVKARLFVMTLRDHFREKVQEIKLIAASDAESSREQSRTDDWALEYISVTWLQPIMEAFDDDGSGYITITEVNQFTESLPTELGWSSQHWIAYWAVGFQLAATKYKEKIEHILALMYGLRSRLLPENHYWADYYLRKVWSSVVEITAGLQTPDLPDHLEAKFEPYISHEEERIRKNLQDIRFDIDALDTVYVVAGPGRIEKHLLALIYLLLDRDLKLFRIAQTKILHEDELWDSADSLLWVTDSAVIRVHDLADLYEQQKMDVDAQLKTVACGLFSNLQDLSEIWSTTNTNTQHFPYTVSNEELDANGPDAELETLLNYPLPTEYPLSTFVYETKDEVTASPDSSQPQAPMFGQWSGYVYTQDEFPEFLVWSWIFEAVPDDENAFQASGVDYDADPYTLKGHYSQAENGVIEAEFIITYESGYATEYYKGHLDEAGSFTGFKGVDENVSEDNHSSLFIFRRISPEIMVHRPSPMELASNKYRALWKFALEAVVTQTRRRLWSWSFFRERRDLRKRYIELNIRLWEFGPPLDEEERAAFLASRRALIPYDALFYLSIRKHMLSIIPKHFDFECDGCKQPMGGGRLICLDCRSDAPQLWQTVDFCADPRCYSASVTQEQRYYLEKPHVPTHDLVKIRTFVQWGDLPALDQTARAALQHCRQRMVASVETPSEEPKDAESSAGSEDVSGPKSQSVHSEGATEAPATDDVFRCFACHTVTELPCWYCTQCTDCVICDSCEAKSLLPCVTCSEPFVQPSWYYGSNPKDNFMCNVCSVKGLDPPAEMQKDCLHTYLHPLVRCKERIDDPVEPPEPTTEDRLILLESCVRSIQESLGDKFGSMETALCSLQQTMSALMAKLESRSNGHAV